MSAFVDTRARHSSPCATVMAMTRKGTRLWIDLVGLAGVGGAYAPLVCSVPLGLQSDQNLSAQQGTLFLLVLAGSVTALTFGHVPVLVRDRQVMTDERDRAIGLRAARYGSDTLAAGVLLALCAAEATQGNAAMAHVLLVSWVIAQSVEIVFHSVAYRRES